MKLDVGVDIVEIDRIRKACRRLGKRFLNRIFTPQEQAYCGRKSDPVPHLAARFAAKEAVYKGLGLKRGRALRWREIEVVSHASGKPLVHLSGALAKEARAGGVRKMALSLSHSKRYAVAQVVIL